MITYCAPYTVADGRWRLAVAGDAVDPLFPGHARLPMRISGFFRHNGVDFHAVARAASQALWHRRVVSGGSTLTMQVARLLEDGSTGRWAGKLRQVRLALALERRLSKAEILMLYLHRAPYGGNLEGVRAGLACMVRQGTDAPDSRSGGTAGCTAAIAGAASA